MISMRIARPFVGALITLATLPVSSASAPTTASEKLDSILVHRSGMTGRSDVIVTAKDAASLDEVRTAAGKFGGSPGLRLQIIHAQVVKNLPNAALIPLANIAAVKGVSLDRAVRATLERTGATVFATTVRQQWQFDGTGIGVAVIDSGITPWHDDLANPTGGGQRVDRFVDLVGGHTTPYDNYGHGTHVAGIIAGNGFDSSGNRSGIAPGVRLVVLKALDATGSGVISDVIAAMEYVVTHRAELNTRILNISVATGVYESYDTDPLTVAAREVVKANIIVCAAAGNLGRNSSNGKVLYSGITAPGNAPWVLTVGASSHMGTINRADDTMAAFSSRGPTAIDATAKPDLVAPGVGIESLSDPQSALYTSKSAYLLNGTVTTSYKPYLSLSGTSMSTPVVTGTVALMLQANPSLTPNLVKAILQYTAEQNDGYDPLTEGAGFLNTLGAVTLARYLANPSSSAYPSSPLWSMHITWGNYSFHGGRLTTGANAWPASVQWGETTVAGQTPEFGMICSTTSCDSGGGTWNRWDTTAESQNVVWGTTCNGANCAGAWTFKNMTSVAGQTVVWGTDEKGDTVVWGTGDGDTVVWGTGGEGDTVVWGTTCTDSSCYVLWKR